MVDNNQYTCSRTQDLDQMRDNLINDSERDDILDWHTSNNAAISETVEYFHNIFKANQQQIWLWKRKEIEKMLKER